MLCYISDASNSGLMFGGVDVEDSRESMGESSAVLSGAEERGGFVQWCLWGKTLMIGYRGVRTDRDGWRRGRCCRPMLVGRPSMEARRPARACGRQWLNPGWYTPPVDCTEEGSNAIAWEVRLGLGRGSLGT